MSELPMDMGDLKDRMQACDLSGSEGADLLQRFLESVRDGSMDGHRLVASAIYGAADDLDDPQRSLMLEQMFHALMRALEDYATLCLMWLDDQRHPLEVFLGTDKAAIRRFYAKARKGLDQESRFKLFGVAAPETMVQKKLVAASDNYTLESVLGWALNRDERLLGAFGRVYHSAVDEADPIIGPWQVSYAMSAMGTKMLLGEDGRPEELLLGLGAVEKGKQAVFKATVRVDARLGEETLHHIENVCGWIRALADLRLALAKDPAAGLERARLAFEEQVSGLKKGEEVGVPSGLNVRQEKPSKLPPLAGEKEEPKEQEEEEEKETPSSGKSGQAKELGGLKIIHSQTIKDED